MIFIVYINKAGKKFSLLSRTCSLLRGYSLGLSRVTHSSLGEKCVTSPKSVSVGGYRTCGFQQNCMYTNNNSNDNHRLKSAVDMPICVVKGGDLCDRVSSRENEAIFLHQNEVILRDRETSWLPTSICSACICTGIPMQT